MTTATTNQIKKVEYLHDALRQEGKIAATIQQAILDEIKGDNSGQLFVDFAAFYEPKSEQFDQDDTYKLAIQTFNNDMSKLRMRIGRACEALDMPKHTVKKVEGSWQWVKATKQAAKPKDRFYQEVAKFIASKPTDADKETVIRLMHTLMDNAKG